MPVIGRTLSAWRPHHRLTCRCCTQRTPEVVLHSNGRKATLFDERPYGFTQCPPYPNWVNSRLVSRSLGGPLSPDYVAKVASCMATDLSQKHEPGSNRR